MFCLINSTAAIYNSSGHFFVFGYDYDLDYSFSLFFSLLADSLLSPGISFHFTPFPVSLTCFSGCVRLFV